MRLELERQNNQNLFGDMVIWNGFETSQGTMKKENKREFLSCEKNILNEQVSLLASVGNSFLEGFSYHC